MTPTQFKKNQNMKKELNIVNISNSLIESFVSKSNLGALKVLFYLSYDSSVKMPNSRVITLKIDSKKLCETCDIDMRTFKRNIQKMQETTITFIKDNEFEQHITVLPSVTYEVGTSIVEIDIYKKVLELVKEVKSKFTVIDITNLMRLKSKHSVKMIQLLSYINGFGENVGKRKTYDLEELNGMFSTNYKNVYEFERKILKPTKEELDSNSKLTFTYRVKFEEATKGRPKAKGVIIDLVKTNSVQQQLF
jgi:plasmid replication initiation protein